MVRPSRFKRQHLLEQALDDHRRQALRRLIEQQQLGVAHQRARDRQHLLLAARQNAAHAVAQLAELRKELRHAVRRPAPGAVGRAGSDLEVLPHRELGEDAPVLRHVADAAARQPVGRGAGDVLALEAHVALRGRRQAHDRAHGGGLADAVAAEQADALAGLDVERDAEQHAARCRRRYGCPRPRAGRSMLASPR